MSLYKGYEMMQDLETVLASGVFHYGRFHNTALDFAEGIEAKT